MANERYRDATGVDWIFYRVGLMYAAYQDPDSARKYPDPPDLGGDVTRAMLVKKVEEYAKAHKGEVQLVVTARADGSGWVLLLLLVLAMSETK